MPSPNFLFIITDQHRADHLGCYGNRIVQTPHIDSIAQRGLRFDRFHVATPVCMPNRASIMTGRYPSVHDSRSNGIPLSLDATTFTDLLRVHGWRTALIGKSHLQSMEDQPPILPTPVARGLHTDGLEDASRTKRVGPEYRQELRSSWRAGDHRLQLPYYGFDHVELCNNHSDKTFGDWGRWVADRCPHYEQLIGPKNALPDGDFTAAQCWRTQLPEALYSTSYIAERSISFLHQHARQQPEKPFFLQCSFPDPHHPFAPPGKYWGMYRPDDIPLPPTCREPSSDAPPTLKWLHEERRKGEAVLTSQRVFAATPSEVRQMTALTYGLITMVDDAVGRILDTLAASGLADNTVVVFTSDHGDFMGDHSLMLKGPLHYQGLVRVPFIWADPAGVATAQVTDRLASSIDIAPTILGRAGIAPFNGVQGKDLLGTGVPDNLADDVVLIEEDNQRSYLGFSQPVRVRTMLTRRHRLSIYQGVDWGEIYDLEADPHETRNLWGQDMQLQADLLQRLSTKMMLAVDRSPRPMTVA